MRAKRILISTVVAAAIGVAVQWLSPSPDAPFGKREERVQPRGDSAKAAHPVPIAELPARARLARPAGQPFRPLSWEAPSVKSTASASTEPPRPVVPYRVAGTVTYRAQPEIVLVKGNEVVIVREGDTLDDGYRVEAVGPDFVSLVYQPLGIVERLPIAMESPPPARAAAGGSSSSPAPLPPLPAAPTLPPLPPLQR